MSLHIVTVCVNYDDFLAATLPNMLAFADYVTVVTSMDDEATQMLVRKLGTGMFRTDAWYNDGAPFNKGAGLNRALEFINPNDWLLLLDADIMLPKMKLDTSKLDKRKLYGARRYGFESKAQWDNIDRRDPNNWNVLPPMALPKVIRGKLWGVYKTANPIGAQGYFQLWHWPSHPHRLKEHRTAAKYDIRLAMKWPDNMRELLPVPNFGVAHLGQRKVNWEGRTSKRWGES
jgi:hypothetical protein